MRFSAVSTVKGKAFSIASVWIHWLYGSLLGIFFWLLAGVFSIPVLTGIIIYFLCVWLLESVIIIPSFTDYGNLSKWAPSGIAIDIFHHPVYALFTGIGWQLTGISG